MGNHAVAVQKRSISSGAIKRGHIASEQTSILPFTLNLQLSIKLALLLISQRSLILGFFWASYNLELLVLLYDPNQQLHFSPRQCQHHCLEISLQIAKKQMLLAYFTGGNTSKYFVIFWVNVKIENYLEPDGIRDKTEHVSPFYHTIGSLYLNVARIKSSKIYNLKAGSSSLCQ